MEKYKVLAVAQMVSTMILIIGWYMTGNAGIYTIAGSIESFMLGLGVLTVTLFGALGALTLDKIK